MAPLRGQVHSKRVNYLGPMASTGPVLVFGTKLLCNSHFGLLGCLASHCSPCVPTVGINACGRFRKVNTQGVRQELVKSYLCACTNPSKAIDSRAGGGHCPSPAELELNAYSAKCLNAYFASD